MCAWKKLAEYRLDNMHGRANVYFSGACKWKVLAFHDDDKYCIKRRHAIFIVAAERNGLAERKFYLWHLEVPVQPRRGRGIEASRKLAKLYILCILRAALRSRIRINRISGLTLREVHTVRRLSRTDCRERLEEGIAEMASTLCKSSMMHIDSLVNMRSP